MPSFLEGLSFDGSGLAVSPNAPPSPPATYLGRFQVGQVVPIAVIPVDGAGYPTAPDVAPVATITDDDNHVIAVVKMAMDGDSQHFKMDYLLGFDVPLGTYSIAYSYLIDGAEASSAGSFDVIAGGDAGGAVVSLYAYARPEAQYVLAQLTSGMIVCGRNPRI